MRLFFPFYSSIDRRSLDFGPVDFLQNLEIRMGERQYQFSVMYTWLSGSSLQVYLVDCPELFHRSRIYTEDQDEVVRFGLLCRAALESCQRMGWSPEIVHCNDWHTALIPVYLRAFYTWDELLANAKTVLTLHNVGYQGIFAASVLHDLGLGDHLSYFDAEDLRADLSTRTGGQLRQLIVPAGDDLDVAPGRVFDHDEELTARVDVVLAGPAVLNELAVEELLASGDPERG